MADAGHYSFVPNVAQMKSASFKRTTSRRTPNASPMPMTTPSASPGSAASRRMSTRSQLDLDSAIPYSLDGKTPSVKSVTSEARPADISPPASVVPATAQTDKAADEGHYSFNVNLASVRAAGSFKRTLSRRQSQQSPMDTTGTGRALSSKSTSSDAPPSAQAPQDVQPGEEGATAPIGNLAIRRSPQPSSRSPQAGPISPTSSPQVLDLPGQTVAGSTPLTTNGDVTRLGLPRGTPGPSLPPSIPEDSVVEQHPEPEPSGALSLSTEASSAPVAEPAAAASPASSPTKPTSPPSPPSAAILSIPVPVEPSADLSAPEASAAPTASPPSPPSVETSTEPSVKPEPSPAKAAVATGVVTPPKTDSPASVEPSSEPSAPAAASVSEAPAVGTEKPSEQLAPAAYQDAAVATVTAAITGAVGIVEPSSEPSAVPSPPASPDAAPAQPDPTTAEAQHYPNFVLDLSRASAKSASGSPVRSDTRGAVSKRLSSLSPTKPASTTRETSGKGAGQPTPLELAPAAIPVQEPVKPVAGAEPPVPTPVDPIAKAEAADAPRCSSDVVISATNYSEMPESYGSVKVAKRPDADDTSKIRTSHPSEDWRYPDSDSDQDKASSRPGRKHVRPQTSCLPARSFVEIFKVFSDFLKKKPMACFGKVPQAKPIGKSP